MLSQHYCTDKHRTSVKSCCYLVRLVSMHEKIAAVMQGTQCKTHRNLEKQEIDRTENDFSIMAACIYGKQCVACCWYSKACWDF